MSSHYIWPKILKNGDIDWPLRSPDLAPPDLSLVKQQSICQQVSEPCQVQGKYWCRNRWYTAPDTQKVMAIAAKWTILYINYDSHSLD